MHIRNSSLAALALAAAVAAAGASAQEDANQAIERCRTLPTEAERFACMEGLVRGMSVPAPAPPSQPEPVPPVADAPPPPAGAAATAAGEEGRSFFRLPFVGRRAEPEAAPTVASTEPEAEAFGAEQMDARDEERSAPELMTAQVVEFEEAHFRRLRVTLDNGQVWEQQDAVPPWSEDRYGAPQDVEIWRSGFGGYRMQIVGRNLVLGVERVR